MFVQTYGAALLIVLFSLVLGRAICAFAGGRQRWWAAPAVGLAAAIILADAAIKLPGKAVTSVSAEILAVAAAATYLALRHRPAPGWWKTPRLAWGQLNNLAIGLAALLVASMPFLASGRVGLLGVSLDNDTDNHLLWAETVRSSRMALLWGTQSSYPLGPHSLVATVGTATGAPLNLVFTGLLVAVVPITAMTAAGVLARERWWRRAVAGILCSLGYLLAAYYAEGAFKETIIAALLLAFVLLAEQVRARWCETAAKSRWRLLIPAVILVVGSVYTYSYLGLAWFASAIALWAVAQVIAHPGGLRRWFSRRGISDVLPELTIAGGLGVILLLPIAAQIINFYNAIGTSPAAGGGIPATALGNLPGPLSGYEMLGIWWSPDFRLASSNTFMAGELSAFALALAIYGLVWAVRRRQLLLVAAVVGSVAIYLHSRGSQSPYVTAKALVIATPIVMAVILRGLLSSREGLVPIRVARLAVAALFCAAAGYSSYQALRDEPVQAPEPGRELAAFHRIIGNSRVLTLGDDDYAPWQLHASAVSALASNSPSLGGALARPSKPYVFGQSLDFDSVTPAGLDNFRYVIAPNTDYASQVPPNFKLVASARLYTLFERTGPTEPRQTLEAPGSAGAILDCRSSTGRRLQTARGFAATMTPPVTVPGSGLTAGGGVSLHLPLPKGEWQLSIQYLSSFDLNLSALGRRWTMPAYLGRQGPFFAVGAVEGTGAASPVTLSIAATRPSVFTGPALFASISVVAATRLPDVRRVVPLGRACGKYVDWYRVT